jgi:hypothetical protein
VRSGPVGVDAMVPVLRMLFRGYDIPIAVPAVMRSGNPCSMRAWAGYHRL